MGQAYNNLNKPDSMALCIEYFILENGMICASRGRDRYQTITDVEELDDYDVTVESITDILATKIVKGKRHMFT